MAKEKTKTKSKTTKPATAPAMATAPVKTQVAQITKLLKGLDNETTAIVKAQDAIDKRVDQIKDTFGKVQNLITGLSNAAMDGDKARKDADAAMAKLQKQKDDLDKAAARKADAEKKAAEKKAAADAKKAEADAKKAAAEKKAAEKKAAKPATAVKTAPKTEPAAKAAKAGERPPLKNAIDGVLKANGTPMRAAQIYNEVVEKHGVYTRQSLYSALKDTKKYVRAGEGADAVFSLATSPVAQAAADAAVTEDDADKFAATVAAQIQAPGAAVEKVI